MPSEEPTTVEESFHEGPPLVEAFETDESAQESLDRQVKVDHSESDDGSWNFAAAKEVPVGAEDGAAPADAVAEETPVEEQP